MGGLGNQMFQYALGRRLAIERNVTLKLDLSWFETQTLRRYMLSYFEIAAEIATPEEIANLTKPKWNRVFRWVHRGLQQSLPYYDCFIVGETKLTFDPNIVKKVPQNALLVGYWQSEKYFEGIDTLIRHEFQPKVPYSAENRPWVEQAGRPFAISVHIRRTDYIDNPVTNAFHCVCSLEYYRQARDIIHEKIPQARFIVFSDDIPWARQNMGFLSPACFVETTGERKDEEELILMSLCSHHIIANSSFSWWAAWLGNNPEKIVIAPRQWFNDVSLDTSDLIPETWIRL